MVILPVLQKAAGITIFIRITFSKRVSDERIGIDNNINGQQLEKVIGKTG